MAAVPDHLTGLTKPGVKFVSVMGSLTRTSAANLFEVVYQFAERDGRRRALPSRAIHCEHNRGPPDLHVATHLQGDACSSPSRPASTWRRLTMDEHSLSSNSAIYPGWSFRISSGRVPSAIVWASSSTQTAKWHRVMLINERSPSSWITFSKREVILPLRRAGEAAGCSKAC